MIKQKRLVALLLIASVYVHAEIPEPETAEEEQHVTWVDNSHEYATNQAQALTQWMDNFFGDPLSDLEQAESFFRLELVDDWDARDGHNFKTRLRGKVQLPKISSRLEIVFSGEEEEHVDGEERDDEDRIGLQYNFLEGIDSRFDATIGVSSGHLRPGVRFRNEGPIKGSSSYRVVQQVQYHDKDGFFSTTQLDINHALDSDDVIRWSNRIKYGQETEGAEWRGSIALRQRYFPNTKRPLATSTFIAINGVTQRNSFTKNYRVGIRMRRQVYRDFLFLELEPVYNFRRDEYQDERKGVWSLVVRVEIVLEKDLRRRK